MDKDILKEAREKSGPPAWWSEEEKAEIKALAADPDISVDGVKAVHRKLLCKCRPWLRVRDMYYKIRKEL